MEDNEHMPDEARLRDLLVGKSVVCAEVRENEPPEPWAEGPTGYLTLSDGTVLKVWGNDGGCSCSAGCYPLTNLNGCDNVITNVIVEERPGNDEEDNALGYYRIFVWAEEELVNLASFEGSDGNGYYGTGWWLKVISKEME